MTIKLLCIGKTDNRELKQLIEVYKNAFSFIINLKLILFQILKRLKAWMKINKRKKKGELILAKVQNSDFLMLLDENGKEFSSEKFSAYIQKRLNSGLKQLIFVIGGPYGFSEAVYQRADSKVALSQMTFSHQMVRLFFTEQLYRAFTILKNEPYHHR